MLRVFEAELIGYLADRQAGLDEQLLRTFDDGILNVALGSGAAFLANQVAEVVGRQTGLVGKVGHGGQAVPFWMATHEVFAQLLMESGEDVAVHLVARDELAVVVTNNQCVTTYLPTQNLLSDAESNICKYNPLIDNDITLF